MIHSKRRWAARPKRPTLAATATFSGTVSATAVVASGNMTAAVVKVAGGVVLQGSTGASDLPDSTAVVQWGSIPANSFLPPSWRLKPAADSESLYVQKNEGSGWTTVHTFT